MPYLRWLRRISDGYFRPIAPAPYKPEPNSWRSDRVTMAWLGHATVLVDFLGIMIMTDPVLRARVGVSVGPVTIGPKRYVAPALRIRELPPLDFVLLTHAHMDHLDLGTLKRLPRDTAVITAKSTADLLTPLRFRQVIEMGWGERRSFETAHGTLTVRAFKVRHWGARIRHDLHRGFNGYLLTREGRQLCLMCDTARTNIENVLHDKPIDVMTVPIGAYDPWIASHCTPEEAVAMANQVRARFVVPIHHQTFRLSREPMDEPIRRFKRAIEPERLALSHIGETFELR